MFYVMKHHVDEWGQMYSIAARVAPYKTKDKAEKKMHKIGKGAFLIDRHRTVIAVHETTH